jgi:S-adenosylmethionine/arginine decarboxylase-like enzyme
MKLSVSENQMEQVEKHLLDVLKAIDKANVIIWEGNEFLNDAQALTKIKSDVKRILNANWDSSARRKLGVSV